LEDTAGSDAGGFLFWGLFFEKNGQNLQIVPRGT
jgi:hypothetical protein